MHYLKRKLQNKGKKGTMTFPSLLIAGSLLLAGFFFMVDVPLKLVMSNEMVNNLDNATSSAVTLINEDLIREGKLEIDEDKATDAIYEMMAELYDLNLDASKRNFILTEESKLTTIPQLEVYVFNRPKNAPDLWKKTITLPSGEVMTITKSSVVAYAKMNFDSLVRKNDSGLELERVSASQVGFPAVVEN